MPHKNRYRTPSIKKASFPYSRQFMNMTRVKVFFQECECWVNLSKRGRKDGVFRGLAGRLRGISGGQRPRELPRSSPASPVLPDSFIQIYILFQIGFRISPPQMHRRFRIGFPKTLRRFRIGPSKIHIRFCIGPPQVSANFLQQQFHSQWILAYHGFYARKAIFFIWNEMQNSKHQKNNCVF